MVLVAAFTLRALKTAFFGESTGNPAESAALEKITAPEKIGALLLVFSTLAIGVYPRFLLDRIMPAVEAMTFLQR